MDRLIPKPRGRFLKVKCPECEGEQIIYTRGAMVVKCNLCGSVLAEPTGGMMDIHAEKIEYVDTWKDNY